MWNEYITTINNFKYNNLQEYITNYISAFNINLYSLEKTQELLVHSSIDLFPERKVLSECFNSGEHIDLFISVFYHLDTLNLSWLFIEEPNVPIETIFNESSRFFIYRLIGFYPELLLEHNDKDRTLTYLFLYFMPNGHQHSLLYHYDKKIPLLSIHQISLYHFDMLLFLMKEYDKISFNLYCQEYNLNHLLLESFMDNANALFSFTDNINWYDILPIPKIYKLLDYGCNFNLFSHYRNQKHLYTFEDLPNTLSYMEKEYFNNKLINQLSDTKNLPNNIIKI
jgi:hypothetical protein